MVKLTDQQEAIVRHTFGPALVFAVAGSGKTTCMVHRIKHLIEQKVVPPDQILATSFNKSATEDIRRQLQQLGVASGVTCQTLHALGYGLIREAVRRGYLSRRWLHNEIDPEEAHSRLIHLTVTQLAIEAGVDVADLNIDREDLKNQISIWKGNLMYADLAGAVLPEAALSLARQAGHEHEMYVRAYRKYEFLRRQHHLLTFDDMLLTGWELLIRHPDLLNAIRRRYRMVMVDEFQDVNFAQYQMLDLITEPHRNYMAIGDDDQCIYEWRGADPRFILEFENVYGATVYTISDNFRSTAQQLALANAVIAHNRRRYPKRLSLTRGFRGETHIHAEASHLEVARAIVGEIRRRLKQNPRATESMAILIRLYSQTALLEATCIDAGLPYQIVGAEPFYKRTEVVTLMQYLSFAEKEKAIRKQGFPRDEAEGEKYLKMFRNIINKPWRYVSRDIVDAVVEQARRRRESVIAVLLAGEAELKPKVRRQVEEFATAIDRLIPKLRRPAAKTLAWLVEYIGYRKYLTDISGIRELGLARVQTVDALITLAEGRGKCGEFLEYLRRISTAPPISSPAKPIPIMTLYRAKGLEWDTVFIPGCNEGLIPCAPALEVASSSDQKGNEEPPSSLSTQEVEAERRLFYVGITRARRVLHLYYARSEPLSPFLEQADYASVLSRVQRVKKILLEEKPFIREKDLFFLCREIDGLHLQRYFRRWAGLPEGSRKTLRLLVEDLHHRMHHQEKQHRAYQQALRAYQQAKQQYERQRRQLQETISRTPVVIRKYKSALHPVKAGDTLEFDYYSDGEVMVTSQRGLVGVVEFSLMPGVDREAVIWPLSVAEVCEVAENEPLIRARLIQVKFSPQYPAFAGFDRTPPKPPPQYIARLNDPQLQKNLQILLEAVK